MSVPAVSIHPYFKAHPGQLEAARAILPRFVARTATEATCYAYDFTISGDTIACRESYVDAAAALAHLQNVDAELKELLTIADLARLEIHGPAAEIDKLRPRLAALNPAYFTYETGVVR